MDKVKVLLTGASGFLGKYLVEALASKHISFITAGRSPENIVRCDLSKTSPDQEMLKDVTCVIHAAGKAHMIPSGKQQEQEMFDVNTTGTIHLLNSLNPQVLRSFVYISTVSVYGREQGENIHEESELLAQDSYGKSKIAAEKAVTDYCLKHHVNYCILRLPLIAGHHPPGNLGAMMEAMQKGHYFRVGKGDARKSVVWAKDVAQFIPTLWNKSGIYNLTDGVHPTFAALENHIAAILHLSPPRTIPYFFLKMAASAGDLIGNTFPINTARLRKITSTLTFSDAKARKELKWEPHEVTRYWTDIL